MSLEAIEKGSPQAGVLKHWRGMKPIKLAGEGEEFEMWAYPDGIKVYDHNLNVINDSEPDFSFGESHAVGLGGETDDQPPNYIYSFVHTDYSLNRTYFSALCWHVPFEPLRKGATFL